MPDLESAAFSFVFARITATRPRMSKQGNKLVATSDWKSQLLSLGFGGRRLEVDPAQKSLRLVIRKFWFWRTSRRIQFDWVDEVLYGYAEVAPAWGAYQENDLYTVGLQLKNGQSLTLFRFYGQGDFVNNTVWPDWMFWDDYLLANYTRGDQEPESLLFADLISRMIGVPISNPTP